MNRQKKKKPRSRTRTSRPSIRSRILDIKSEDLARYARDAEQQALPIIKKLEVSPGAAIGLLAQYTHMLISGNSDITIQRATKVTDSILALWQAGSYHPSEQYPFTLEETLQDFKEGLKVEGDYSKDFQPFIPSQSASPLGIGQIACGIVKHPKTLLWQTWVIMNGPCAFLGAYRDSNDAQRKLENIINIARYGSKSIRKSSDVDRLYDDLISQGDGEPAQLPYEMMSYLLNHLHLYLDFIHRLDKKGKAE